MTQPVPNSGSTILSAIIGIFLPTIGKIALLPIKSLKRLSDGFTATATSPSIVSGLVVAISINESEFSIAYLIYHNLPLTSLKITSSSLSAVCDFGHQFTNLFPL